MKSTSRSSRDCLGFFSLLVVSVALSTAIGLLLGLQEKNNLLEDPSSTPESLFLLQTVLCQDFCEKDCRSFLTPLNQCYNAKRLFPTDPSWSQFDMLDELIGDDDTLSSFRRMIFETTDGACGSADFDSFVLPADGSCVGPFGKPRPWGNFSVIEVVREEVTETTV